MKKLYSKKLGGEAFALDAAQLDTLKKAGYTAENSIVVCKRIRHKATGLRRSPHPFGAA